MWVLPVSMLLWTIPGFGIAYWIVPGSPIDLKYHLATETIEITNLWLPMMIAIGIVLALIYVTLYRGIYRKLPVSLLTDTKEFAWRDLRWPVVCSAVSIVTGLIVIW